MKRFFDLVLSLVALLILLIPIVLVTLAVKLTSKGPALYWSDRVGVNNVLFRMPKFRSMRTGTPAVATHLLLDPSQYLTPIGNFLRKSSLDELPQFVNVLQGRMSIVGPRPHAVAHNEQYRKLIKGYMLRHKVKPGITGWAQVNGLRGETETLDKMEARIRFDLEYLRNWSLLLDIWIIIRTVKVVLKRDNAH